MLSLTCPGTQCTRRDEAQNTWKRCRGTGCPGPWASSAGKRGRRMWTSLSCMCEQPRQDFKQFQRKHRSSYLTDKNSGHCVTPALLIQWATASLSVFWTCCVLDMWRSTAALMWKLILSGRFKVEIWLDLTLELPLLLCILTLSAFCRALTILLHGILLLPPHSPGNEAELLQQSHRHTGRLVPSCNGPSFRLWLTNNVRKRGGGGQQRGCHLVFYFLASPLAVLQHEGVLSRKPGGETVLSLHWYLKIARKQVTWQQPFKNCILFLIPFQSSKNKNLSVTF
jgi:hypothetical protein